MEKNILLDCQIMFKSHVLQNFEFTRHSQQKKSNFQKLQVAEFEIY